MNTQNEPNEKIKQLIKYLAGKWKIKGPGIDGEAEYRSMKEGFLLVQNVDFVADGTRIKAIQHIAYDEGTDTLRAQYMDTVGNDGIYTWMVDGKRMRVSQGSKDSDTYYEATLNDDNSEYTGTWHYPNGGNYDATAERITYTRMK